MREFEVPEDHCIGCGHALDGARSLNNEHARVGDVTVCCYCGAIMEFGEGMKLKPLSNEAVEKLIDTPLWKEVVELQKRIGKIL